MTIEYSLTRTEIARGFFLSLRKSPKFRRTVLIYAVGVGAFDLFLRMFRPPVPSLRDVLVACAWSVGIFLFMPVWLFIRSKTAQRTVVTSPEGIYSEIGKLRIQIPWREIAAITDAGRYILVMRRGGNSFFVPDQAFSGASQRDEFLGELRRWTS
jgi:YcxB-like protein